MDRHVLHLNASENAQHPESVDKPAVENSINLLNCCFFQWGLSLLICCDYPTREAARSSLFEYMEVFYNRQRRHSALDYEAPLAFEAMNP